MKKSSSKLSVVCSLSLSLSLSLLRFSYAPPLTALSGFRLLKGEALCFWAKQRVREYQQFMPLGVLDRNHHNPSSYFNFSKK